MMRQNAYCNATVAGTIQSTSAIRMRALQGNEYVKISATLALSFTFALTSRMDGQINFLGNEIKDDHRYKIPL